MYKSSNDRRFRKNKKEIRRAFIDLVIEKGYRKITISDIAERADINRMTFYAHYDTVEDVFTEFVDDMAAEIETAMLEKESFDIDEFFELLNGLMLSEESFFRYVATEGKCSDFIVAFIRTINKLITIDIAKELQLSDKESMVFSDLASVTIAYSYLDWLSGKYGDMPLSELTTITKRIIRGQVTFSSL